MKVPSSFPISLSQAGFQNSNGSPGRRTQISIVSSCSVFASNKGVHFSNWNGIFPYVQTLLRMRSASSLHLKRKPNYSLASGVISRPSPWSPVQFVLTHSSIFPRVGFLHLIFSTRANLSISSASSMEMPTPQIRLKSLIEGFKQWFFRFLDLIWVFSALLLECVPSSSRVQVSFGF